jgi:hypothetical protein
MMHEDSDGFVIIFAFFFVYFDEAGRRGVMNVDERGLACFELQFKVHDRNSIE